MGGLNRKQKGNAGKKEEEKKDFLSNKRLNYSRAHMQQVAGCGRGSCGKAETKGAVQGRRRVGVFRDYSLCSPHTTDGELERLDKTQFPIKQASDEQNVIPFTPCPRSNTGTRAQRPYCAWPAAGGADWVREHLRCDAAATRLGASTPSRLRCQWLHHVACRRFGG